jgi:hypothetical protein
MDLIASEERAASIFTPHNRLNNEAAGSSETLSDLHNYTALEESDHERKYSTYKGTQILFDTHSPIGCVASLFKNKTQKNNAL